MGQSKTPEVISYRLHEPEAKKLTQIANKKGLKSSHKLAQQVMEGVLKKPSLINKVLLAAAA